MQKENKIPSNLLFGEDVPVGLRENEISPKEEEKIIAVATESLEDYYKRTMAHEEKFSKREEEIENLFSDYDFEEEVKENNEQVSFETEEELFGEFEEENDNSNSFVDFFENRKELEEEISDIDDEQLELELNNIANQKVKELCESPFYPEGFPTYEELLKLKIKHDKLVFVISGNLLEEFQFSIEPKLFICTTFKTKDYIEFNSVYSDEQEVMLYPFVVSRCTLFPKINFETIMELNAGTLKKIADNVLINSDYKTSLEVIVL